MKTASLSGSPREGVGKKDATELRAKGQVPGVLYGGSEQVHFHVNEVQLNKLIFTPDTYLIQFEVGGASHNCVVQDIQFHPVTDRIVHIDLLQVFPDKPISKKPLETRMGKGKADVDYWAARVKAGTILYEISGVPEDLAKQAMSRVARKMPVRCRFVGRRLSV